jgi:glutamate-1-semialdehyde aminotransferase
VPHMISGVPAMFGVLPGVDPAAQHDFRSISRQTDDALSREICAGLHARGVMPDPDCGEPWFLSYSHSDADIDRTLEAYEEVMATV